MKLLVVLSIKEYQGEVAKVLQESGVAIFSVSSVTGYKKKEYNPGWFGSGSGRTDSIVLFSFTEESIAQQALRNINMCNTEGNPFPVKAYIMNVEEFSK